MRSRLGSAKLVQTHFLVESTKLYNNTTNLLITVEHISLSNVLFCSVLSKCFGF